MSNVSQLRKTLEQRRGKFLQIQEDVTNLTQDIASLTKALKRHEKAREIIRIVGLKTQEQLQVHISSIASLALDSVLDDPYELSVQFVQRRNKTECDLMFTRDGNTIDPVEASGLGAVDVASFALRVASWSMMHGRLNNTIILDEPMKWLSEDNQEKASKMIKEVSEKLGIQFIIVTHLESLTVDADKVFKFSKRKGVTKIEKL